MPDIELSYCVVNTSQRELLLRGLDAIARERASVPFATEVLVLDNGSRDGSAEAAQAHPAVDEVIALPERRGKALNDSELLRRARGCYALLLNRDFRSASGRNATPFMRRSKERPTAPAQALRYDVPTGAANRPRGPSPRLRRPSPDAVPARRLRSPEQGRSDREVDWCQFGRPARQARRRGAGRLPRPGLLRLLRRGRLRSAAARCSWYSVYVPAAVAIHREQLSTDIVPKQRIVEMSTAITTCICASTTPPPPRARCAG